MEAPMYPSAYVAPFLANDNASQFALDMERLRRLAAVRSGTVAIYGRNYTYTLQADGTYELKGNGTVAVAEPLPNGDGYRATWKSGREARNLGWHTLVVDDRGMRVKR
jgi:hypothetical protein